VCAIAYHKLLPLDAEALISGSFNSTKIGDPVGGGYLLNTATTRNRREGASTSKRKTRRLSAVSRGSVYQGCPLEP